MNSPNATVARQYSCSLLHVLATTVPFMVVHVARSSTGACCSTCTTYMYAVLYIQHSSKWREHYNCTVLYCTVHVPVLYCTVLYRTVQLMVLGISFSAVLLLVVRYMYTARYYRTMNRLYYNSSSTVAATVSISTSY